MRSSGFVVAQLGARMHYAVPRILSDAGMLGHFYTDVCAAKGWLRMLAALPGWRRSAAMKRLGGRLPAGVPNDRITAFTPFGLEYARRRSSAKSESDATAAHLWAGKTFCHLVRREGLGCAQGVYGFNSASLELLQAARREGKLGIVEQTIAPRAFQDALLEEEHHRFPGWEGSPKSDRYAGDYAARERAEWEAADLILCGSEFVKEGICREGGPAWKCAVVPYGGNFPPPAPREPFRYRPLRALFVGAVGLRKGIPYVLASARLLGSRAQIRAAGPIRVSRAAEGELRNFLELAGPVPRQEIQRHYQWADVFVLPSLCEGSATVCYEALAAGLPVITTPNAGSVVRDGVEGFVVPIRDPEAIAEKLERLSANRGLLEELSENARARAAEFSLEAYAERLTGALRNTPVPYGYIQ